MRTLTIAMAFAIAVTFSQTSSRAQRQWSARFTGPFYGWDEPHAAAVDGSGNVYVTGFAQRVDRTRGIATAKYSPTGALLWFDIYGMAEGETSGNAICVDSDGNAYVAVTMRTGLFT